MNLNDYDTSKRVQCTLVGSTPITKDASPQEVRELQLQVAADARYDVGQIIGVLVPGPHPMGNKFHLRLYTLADISPANQSTRTLSIVVRRCNYIDDYSGEEYPGIASNYLCNLLEGDKLLITGPFGYPFERPADKDANIIMIGMGTGIAPFRAFVKMLYRDQDVNNYSLRLFYGSNTGLEMLYLNDRKKDLADYFDKKTFQAIQALSPKFDWKKPVTAENAFVEHSQEVWQLICRHDTYVYIAGIEDISLMLDEIFNGMAGSVAKWQQRKSELIAGKRWVELIY